MTFLRRYGRRGRTQLRYDEIPASLQQGLLTILGRWFTVSGSACWLHSRVFGALYRRPLDTFNYDAENYLSDVEIVLEDCGWGEFYATCEAAYQGFVPLYFGDGYETSARLFGDDLNELFEVEGVPWRMKAGEIVPLFSEEVQGVLNQAADAAQKLGGLGVTTHLDKARRYLMPSNVDEENAVKEAVSAVEAAVKAKAGVDDFDDGLRVLKQQRRLTPHWSAAIQTLFSYASREDQVRHGSPEVSDLTYKEARDLVGLAAVLTQHIAGLPDPR